MLGEYFAHINGQCAIIVDVQPLFNVNKEAWQKRN